MYIDLNNIQIRLDSSVKHISKIACMTLSGAIEDELDLAYIAFPIITIYKDRIDFGKCLNSDLEGMVGFLGIPNFYMEYGNVIYRFDSGYSYSIWSKKIDYSGIFAPTVPDNVQLFNLIYPQYL